MKKSKAIVIPLYGDRIYVFTSPDQIDRKKIDFANPYAPAINGLKGAVADNGNGVMTMYISVDRDCGVESAIAHECYHAVMRIMERVGQSVSCKKYGGEHVAYLLGWLVERVHGEVRRLVS